MSNPKRRVPTANAVGGGGWGPTVTTTLIGSGVEPRKAIGSTNAAEFFVAVSVSTAFIGMLATGHWEDAPGLRDSLSRVELGGRSEEVGKWLWAELRRLRPEAILARELGLPEGDLSTLEND